MSSSSEHIVVHLQQIAEKNYIRIISARDTQSYFEEVQKAYEKPNVLTTHIFYNCADLYSRLVHDLNFKKFKGIDKIHSVCPSLWSVESTGDIEKWYEDVYVPWISNKLASYIEDMDEDPYFAIDPPGVDWKNVTQSGHVTCTFSENKTLYQLNGYEKTSDGMIVLTRDHMLSILFYYVHNNYSSIYNVGETHPSKKPESEEGEKDIDIVVKMCTAMRGAFINKSSLSTEDVASLMKTMGIGNDLMKQVAMCKNYVTILEGQAMTNMIPFEEDPFSTWYSFVGDFDVQDSCGCLYDIVFQDSQVKNVSHGNILAEIEATINNKDGNIIEMIHTRAMKQGQDKSSPQETTKVLFKNLLNDNITLYDEELKFLKEFEKLSQFSYKNTMTANIVTSINNKRISSDFVKELRNLVDILGGGNKNEEECDVDNNTNKVIQTGNESLQKLMTQAYVDLYKNDTLETLASTVIENVYQYLVDSAMRTESINKNQIGKDLVELGVKKTRKSKGYVYGIEDTSNKKRGDGKYDIDHSKASKENHQLRANIPPALNVDPILFCKPGKFLVPRQQLNP